MEFYFLLIRIAAEQIDQIDQINWSGIFKGLSVSHKSKSVNESTECKIPYSGGSLEVPMN